MGRFSRTVRRHGRAGARAKAKRELRELGWEKRAIMRDLMSKPDEAREEGILRRTLNPRVYRAKALGRQVPGALRNIIHDYNRAQDRAFRVKVAR